MLFYVAVERLMAIICLFVLTIGPLLLCIYQSINATLPNNPASNDNQKLLPE